MVLVGGDQLPLTTFSGHREGLPSHRSVKSSHHSPQNHCLTNILGKAPLVGGMGRSWLLCPPPSCASALSLDFLERGQVRIYKYGTTRKGVN